MGILLFSNFVLLLVVYGSESVDELLNIEIDRHKYDTKAPANTYVTMQTSVSLCTKIKKNCSNVPLHLQKQLLLSSDWRVVPVKKTSYSERQCMSRFNGTMW